MQISELPSDPFTAAQSSALGLNRAQLRQLCAARVITRVLYGVYLRADVPLTTEVKIAAAALVINSDAVICDRTAAWIWGVDVFRLSELDVVPAVEAFVLRGRTRVRREQTWGGVRDLARTDWLELGSVKVTTPLRTALDLGCGLNRRDALGGHGGARAPPWILVG